jgi:uncharacterized protein with beta-barrel porin domain
VPGPTNDATAAINTAFATAVATDINTVTAVIPQAFLNLAGLDRVSQALVLRQLSGEISTAIAPAGIQAMNSFLSLVLNPFAGNGFSDGRAGFGAAGVTPVVRTLGYADSGMPTKAPASASIDRAIALAAFDPRRWSVWGAAYGGQSQTQGSAAFNTNDRSARSYGFAAGVDHRILPNTIVGFALGGGTTNFGLANGFGGGRSDMFQSAIYGSTYFGSAYVSAALAYAWHDVTTEQFISVTGDRLAARFGANNFGARLESGYRFAIPAMLVPSFGVTPYVALQGQVYRTPDYTENVASAFARRYEARSVNGMRTEIGAWLDQTTALGGGQLLTLRGRAAWAHDQVGDQIVSSSFVALPGQTFLVQGAGWAPDVALVTAGAELRFANGFALLAQFDGEFAEHTSRYGGVGRLRYSW